MKKYTLLALSIFLIPSASFAQGKNTAIERITKQRDIADYKCKNNLPNPKAAIGFCKKREGLQRKLDNMNNGQYNNNHNNHRHDHHNNRHNNDHNHRH